MFKNPLKYQQGGQTPTQEQQKLLEAFIEWLPKKVKEFQGMQPEQIAQALDGMSKTDEGKKQLQQLMMQFQQEMQWGSQSFKQGGKIYDFVCKHAKGGKAGCGCKEEGGNISKNQHGLSSGRFDIPFGAYMKTYFNKRSTPDVGAATRRSFGYSTSDGNEYYLEGANIGRNSVDTWVNITPKKDTIIMQKLPSNHINDLEDYQMEAIMQRIRPDIKRVNNQENGGKVEKAQNGEKTNDTPYNGTISQGKPRSKVSQAIDNNSKARNFVKGAKNFINSPMVRLPLAGAAAYGGYKLAGILPEAEIKPAKYASMMFLSQLRPKFILDTMNPTKEPSAKEAFWAIPSNKDGGKVEKTQREQRPVYAKCGKKIKKGQFGIAGMPINPKVVKAVYDKVDNFLTPANKWEKEYGTPVIGGLGLPAYVSPVAQEIELAKIIGNRIPTQMSAEKNAAYSIKAASEKQKAIDAATKAGKIYIEPKTPADWDIDLPMFDSKFDIPDLNNIIKFSWPKFIGRNVLLPASGVVGSAAAGSYIATKKDKNKKSENK